MTEIPKKIDLDELLDLYQAEKPINESEKEKLDFDRKHIQQKIKTIASRMLNSYQKSDIDSGGVTVDRSDVWKKNIPLAVEVIDENIPITLFVMKSYTREGERELKSISFILVKDLLDNTTSENLYSSWRRSFSSGKYIGSIELTDKDTIYDINDRWVDPKFRNQGIAGMLLNASEQFIQESAIDKTLPHTAFVNTAQLDVICWFLNKGYKPQTKEDRKRLEEVLNKNEGIELGDEYYVFKNISPKDRVINLPDGRIIPNRHKAHRIKLIKEIEPDIPGLQQSTRLSIEEL